MIVLAGVANVTWIGWWFATTLATVDVMSTVQNGGRLRFKFTGTALTLNMQLTESDIEYSIDGGAFTRVPVTSSMELATGLTDTEHTCEIYTAGVKYDTGTRWTLPSGPSYVSFQIDTGRTITAWPTGNTRQMVVLGDSIAEGLGTNGGTVTESAEGRRNFSNLLSDSLGLDLNLHGFGGTGITQGGYTAPKAIDALPWAMQGIASPSSEDVQLVIIEHGNNDRNATTATFITDYTAYVTAIKVKFPNAKIYVMTPWPGYSTINDHRPGVRSIATSEGLGLIDVDLFGFDMAYAQHPNLTEHATIAGLIAPLIALHAGAIPLDDGTTRYNIPYYDDYTLSGEGPVLSSSVGHYRLGTVAEGQGVAVLDDGTTRKNLETL